MTVEVHVELRASGAVDAVKRDDIMVIIDVLRCSSTIIVALANGASEIIPASTIGKAKELKKRHPNYVLAGERRGLMPQGFELGNSPREFTSEKIYGKGIILTTTNGTKAFEIAKDARPVFVGSFLNAEAAGKAVYVGAKKNSRGISLIACGRAGRLSIEDFACAGTILEMMPTDKLTLSDGAHAALFASKGAGENVAALLCSSEHGRYLKSIGLTKDIEFCSQMNRYTNVPVFEEGRIYTGGFSRHKTTNH
ncbi:MAG: 2-phosphosulfolactate phosphatase [Candidatus Bathyarchaeota archaeon]|nr:MAG: 2-phosphosulfolactate phosphatase [Candidatus Bathyarchaeota archaeon]